MLCVGGIINMTVNRAWTMAKKHGGRCLYYTLLRIVRLCCNGYCVLFDVGRLDGGDKANYRSRFGDLQRGSWVGGAG